LQAQALALARAGDEPRDVGDRVAGLARGDDAEVGHERREGVVGDLRAGGREHRDERGLAGAREADEGDVRERLQLQLDVEELAGLAEQREAGRLAPPAGQGLVAEAAAAPLRQDHGGAGADEVGEHLPGGVGDDRAARDGEAPVLAAGAVALVAGARRPVARPPVRAAVVLEEGRHLRVDDEDDVTAVAAVAAVRAAERLELLPAHGRDAMTALAALHVENDPVHEGRHDLTSSLPIRMGRRRGRATVGPPPSQQRSASERQPAVPAGRTLTVLRPRLAPYCTSPSARANSVSSPPRPTLSPGWKCVPRWRTRIWPVPTISPLKRFTPRRWALESRPFLLEETPFLEDMSVVPNSSSGRPQAL